MSLVALFEKLGFEFSRDEESQSEDDFHIEYPEGPIDPRAVAEALSAFSAELRRELRDRRLRSRRRCIGGPFDGRPHNLLFRYIGNGISERRCPRCGGLRGFAHREPCNPYARDLRPMQIGRGKWAVYELFIDGRCVFIGWASSEKNGKRGQLYSPAQPMVPAQRPPRRRGV